MGFFDMGPLEILLILVIALIIWGPGKIPEVARTLGRTVRAIRKATSDLTTAVTKELELEEKDRPPRPGLNSANKTGEPSDIDEAGHSGTETTGPGG